VCCCVRAWVMCVLWIYVWVCVYNINVCVYYVYGCTCVCMYTGACSCEFMGWVACCSIRPVWWDPDPLQETQIRIRRWFDTLAIRRLTYEMIRRSIPLRAVKIRRWFGPKTASFYVSVCSYIFSLLLLLVGVHISVRIISCDHMIYFSSMIIRITPWNIASV